MEGSTNQLIIGTAERGQAVVLSPDAWLHDIALHDIALHDQPTQIDAQAQAHRSLDNAEREWQSEEHLAALLAGLQKDRADPDRSTPPFQDQRTEAVDVQIAVRLLDEIVTCLESKALEVLLLGEGAVAEAVMIPLDYWLTYLELENQAAGDERITKIVRERKATPLGDHTEFDDFLAEFTEFDDDHD
jgi:hypothetical protein